MHATDYHNYSHHCYLREILGQTLQQGHPYNTSDAQSMRLAKEYSNAPKMQKQGRAVEKKSTCRCSTPLKTLQNYNNWPILTMLETSRMAFPETIPNNMYSVNLFQYTALLTTKQQKELHTTLLPYVSPYYVSMTVLQSYRRHACTRKTVNENRL